MVSDSLRQNGGEAPERNPFERVGEDETIHSSMPFTPGKTPAGWTETRTRERGHDQWPHPENPGLIADTDGYYDWAGRRLFLPDGSPDPGVSGAYRYQTRPDLCDPNAPDSEPVSPRYEPMWLRHKPGDTWMIGGKPFDPDDPGPFGNPLWRPDRRTGRHRRGERPDPIPPWEWQEGDPEPPDFARTGIRWDAHGDWTPDCIAASGTPEDGAGTIPDRSASRFGDAATERAAMRSGGDSAERAAPRFGGASAEQAVSRRSRASSGQTASRRNRADQAASRPNRGDQAASRLNQAASDQAASQFEGVSRDGTGRSTSFDQDTAAYSGSTPIAPQPGWISGSCPDPGAFDGRHGDQAGAVRSKHANCRQPPDESEGEGSARGAGTGARPPRRQSLDEPESEDSARGPRSRARTPHAQSLDEPECEGSARGARNRARPPRGQSLDGPEDAESDGSAAARGAADWEFTHRYTTEADPSVADSHAPATAGRDYHERAVQDRTSRDRAVQHRAVQDQAVQIRATQDHVAQEHAVQDRAVKDRTGQDRARRSSGRRGAAPRDPATHNTVPRGAVPHGSLSDGSVSNDTARQDRDPEPIDLDSRRNRSEATGGGNGSALGRSSASDEEPDRGEHQQPPQPAEHRRSANSRPKPAPRRPRYGNGQGQGRTSMSDGSAHPHHEDPAEPGSVPARTSISDGSDHLDRSRTSMSDHPDQSRASTSGRPGDPDFQNRHVGDPATWNTTITTTATATPSRIGSEPTDASEAEEPQQLPGLRERAWSDFLSDSQAFYEEHLEPSAPDLRDRLTWLLQCVVWILALGLTSTPRLHSAGSARSEPTSPRPEPLTVRATAKAAIPAQARTLPEAARSRAHLGTAAAAFRAGAARGRLEACTARAETTARLRHIAQSSSAVPPLPRLDFDPRAAVNTAPAEPIPGIQPGEAAPGIRPGAAVPGIHPGKPVPGIDSGEAASERRSGAATRRRTGTAMTRPSPIPYLLGWERQFDLNSGFGEAVA